MPTKDGTTRPRAGHGFGSAMTRESMRRKPKVESAKPLRNRPRVGPPKVQTHGRRK